MLLFYFWKTQQSYYRFISFISPNIKNFSKEKPFKLLRQTLNWPLLKDKNNNNNKTFYAGVAYVHNTQEARRGHKILLKLESQVVLITILVRTKAMSSARAVFNNCYHLNWHP